jgi:hypothetical protein
MSILKKRSAELRRKKYTVGGLETETQKLCTGGFPFKDAALQSISIGRVVSWDTCSSWNLF